MKAFAEAGQKVVERSNSRENTTVVTTIGANGATWAPTIIFKGQRLQPDWFTERNGSKDARYTCTDSSFMQGDVFIKYFKDFHQQLDDRGLLDGKPHILVLDGHASHVSCEGTTKRKEGPTGRPPLEDVPIAMTHEQLEEAIGERGRRQLKAGGHVITGLKVGTVMLGGLLTQRKRAKKLATSRGSFGLPDGGNITSEEVLAKADAKERADKTEAETKVERGRERARKKKEAAAAAAAAAVAAVARARQANTGGRGRGHF
ncbi:unnamed protein product [Ectocarpus sp. CCAP 1310/34]|nr:unnamed protein product [Ectocarpus sp. CCAP 1310/34]